MAKTFMVTIGSETFTRTSKTMDYKFAIIGQKDEVKARSYAYDYEAVRTDRSNYDYYCALIAGTHEHARASFYHYMPDAAAADHVRQTVNGARESLAGVKSFEEYLVLRRTQEITWFEKRRAAGYYRMQVLAWSQTERNAGKAAAQEEKHHINVALMQAIVK